MARLRQVDKLIKGFSQQRPIRSGSLIVTLFGDTVAKHGGSVWLGSVIKALEPFGLNHRLVRTAVFRLVQDNWLVSEQIGRRSYYRFTDFGRSRYQKSARRIYSCKRSEWSGYWTLVFYGGVKEEKRAELQKELNWMGYGQVVNNGMARPDVQQKPLEETLQELGVVDQVVVMRANTLGFSSQRVLKNLVHSTWELDALGVRYQEFLDKYRPVFAALRTAKTLDPEQCFQLRTLVIHEYRRIFLTDADLPEELIREDWPGNAARTLIANIYKVIHEKSARYVVQNFESADGPLPVATESYYNRFGGLRDI
ncbi:MAG: phenylacetic acid degradation operon negative regulatory protein PaaX [Pseudomonadales bacterium]